VVGAMSGMEYMVPQSFATRGNRSYLELWVVTSGLRYPGYKTLRVALSLLSSGRSKPFS
jgi:hypothetical protein